MRTLRVLQNVVSSAAAQGTWHAIAPTQQNSVLATSALNMGTMAEIAPTSCAGSANARDTNHEIALMSATKDLEHGMKKTHLPCAHAVGERNVLALGMEITRGQKGVVLPRTKRKISRRFDALYVVTGVI